MHHYALQFDSYSFSLRRIMAFRVFRYSGSGAEGSTIDFYNRRSFGLWSDLTRTTNSALKTCWGRVSPCVCVCVCPLIMHSFQPCMIIGYSYILHTVKFERYLRGRLLERQRTFVWLLIAIRHEPPWDVTWLQSNDCFLTSLFQRVGIVVHGCIIASYSNYF